MKRFIDLKNIPRGIRPSLSLSWPISRDKSNRALEQAEQQGGESGEL